MRILHYILIIVVLPFCLLSQNEAIDNPNTFYGKAKNYTLKYNEEKKSNLPQKFCNWGIREVLNKGYEYNTSGAFEKTYVIYYFDTVNPNNNIGLYYQSDSYYLKDLVKILESNNYSNPSSTLEGWHIPFYCSIYYCTSSPDSDTISLCTPKKWKEGDKIYERKVFEFRADKATPRLHKQFEYKQDNPDPIILLNYEISLYCKDELIRFINRRKGEAKKQESELNFTCPFYNYIDTTEFNPSKKQGWVCFGPIIKNNKTSTKKIENMNFYMKGSLYSNLFPTKKRYTVNENLNLKYKFFHPGRWFKKHEKFVPIYDLAVYDSVDNSGKKDLINCVYNQYYYTLIEKKIVTDNTTEYLWIKLDLEAAQNKMIEISEKYNQKQLKEQKKISDYELKQIEKQNSLKKLNK